jgi:hypothetical protein
MVFLLILSLFIWGFVLGLLIIQWLDEEEE